jgi:hypothetical protein
LYDRAKVAPGEEATLTALGLALESAADRTYFRQPCRFQSGGSCTNYEQRWTVCRTFRCALLRRFEAGELSLADARATVATAHELVATVKAADPSAVLVGERRKLRRELADRLQSGGQQPGSAARRLLDIIALDTFLERWFRNRKADVRTGKRD